MPPFSACSEPRQRQVSWMSVGYKIQYGTQPIEFTVVRRERRTMQISVLPDSSVEVVAPVSVNEKDIVTRMHKRAGWIHKQMRFFQQYQPRTPDWRFVAGETHLYLGRRYRLKIVRGEQSAIKLKRGVIEVHTRFPSRKAAIR
jgi:predicted metal-dependent hydrolase